MKTVLFVPGFGENSDDRNYAVVLRAIESKGYKTVFVPINWQRTTINDWLVELETEYSKYQPKNTILAGFSYGSMTALLAASKRLPAQLWLFSLSPYFAEDLPSLKPVWLKQIGKKRIAAFEQLQFRAICRAVTCPVKLFAGEKESVQLLDRFHDATEKLKNARAILVPETQHVVDAPRYIAVIERAI